MDFTNIKKISIPEMENVIKLTINNTIVWTAKRLKLINGYPIKITDSYDAQIANDYKIYGNYLQNGVPSMENPILVQFVGNKTDNILNINDIIDSKHYGTTGNLETFNRRCATPKYDCRGANYISYYYEHNEDYVITNVIVTWDAEGNLKRRSYRGENGSSSIGTVYIEPDEVQIAIFFQSTGTNVASKDKFTKLMLRLDNVKKYVPFGYAIPINVNGELNTIYLESPLRKVEDKSDYIDFKNKRIVRYFNETLIDSAEKLEINKPFFVRARKRLPNDVSLETKRSNILSSAFFNLGNSSKHDVGGAFLFDSQAYMNLDMNEYGSEGGLTKFNQYLSENPVQFIYELAIPKNEYFDLPDINLVKDINNITVDTSISPSNMEVEYYSK